MRTVTFARGEVYHVYNRGVDKRSLFADPHDFERFRIALIALNQIELVHSLNDILKYTNEVDVQSFVSSKPLVRIHTYCINLNHYHFLLEPLVDDGVQKFMHRLGTSFTNYFNRRHDRSGSLFQGPYKAVHVRTNEHFMHLGCYVTLNNLVHKGMNPVWLERMPFSALQEYAKVGATDETVVAIADTTLLLAQYRSRKKFLKEAHKTVAAVVNMRKEMQEYARLCIE